MHVLGDRPQKRIRLRITDRQPQLGVISLDSSISDSQNHRCREPYFEEKICVGRGVYDLVSSRGFYLRIKLVVNAFRSATEDGIVRAFVSASIGDACGVRRGKPRLHIWGRFKAKNATSNRMNLVVR